MRSPCPQKPRSVVLEPLQGPELRHRSRTTSGASIRHPTTSCTGQEDRECPQNPGTFRMGQFRLYHFKTRSRKFRMSFKVPLGSEHAQEHPSHVPDRPIQSEAQDRPHDHFGLFHRPVRPQSSQRLRSSFVVIGYSLVRLPLRHFSLCRTISDPIR